MRRVFVGVAVTTVAVLVLAGPASASSTASAAPSLSAAGRGASSLSQHPASLVPLRNKAPFDQVFANMDYNGGPLMPSNTDYMVLWSPSGLGAYPAGYVSGLK